MNPRVGHAVTSAFTSKVVYEGIAQLLLLPQWGTQHNAYFKHFRSFPALCADLRGYYMEKRSQEGLPPGSA
jgi:hypothetical protein